MLRRFVRLPGTERALLLRLVVVPAVIRALWRMPFFRMRDVCRRHVFAAAVSTSVRALLPARLAWAVQAANCLTQSLGLDSREGLETFTVPAVFEAP